MAAKKSNVGRPTLYDESMLERAKEYILFFQTAGKEDIENHTEVIPTMSGLAMFLGVSKRVLYLWRDANQDFMHTLEGLQDTQETLLLNNGLRGRFNPQISKLALANHGYSDKPVIDEKDEQATPVQIVVNVQDARKKDDKPES